MFSVSFLFHIFKTVSYSFLYCFVILLPQFHLTNILTIPSCREALRKSSISAEWSYVELFNSGWFRISSPFSSNNFNNGRIFFLGHPVFWFDMTRSFSTYNLIMIRYLSMYSSSYHRHIPSFNENEKQVATLCPMWTLSCDPKKILTQDWIYLLLHRPVSCPMSLLFLGVSYFQRITHLGVTNTHNSTSMNTAKTNLTLFTMHHFNSKDDTDHFKPLFDHVRFLSLQFSLKQHKKLIKMSIYLRGNMLEICNKNL